MAFDFKKEYKEFYMPKNKPQIVTIPKANYIAVRGKGNPNEDLREPESALSHLHGILPKSMHADHFRLQMSGAEASS